MIARLFSSMRTLVPLLFSLAFVSLFLGCEDKILAPQPGILEIRLKSKTTRFLPPTDSTRHGFQLTLSSLSAYRSNSTFMRIFSDVRATDRFDENIDLLDSNAVRDSSLIIGQVYAPPVNFNSITLEVIPRAVSFYNGFSNVIVPVQDSRQEGQEITEVFGNIPVKEFKKTIVTITCDVDSSLQPQLDYFLFVPKFWISSVKVQ